MLRMTLRKTKKENKLNHRGMGAKRYIADMETDGVYFSDEQRRVMEEIRDSRFCQYSGLPSPKAYEIR